METRTKLLINEGKDGLQNSLGSMFMTAISGGILYSTLEHSPPFTQISALFIAFMGAVLAYLTTRQKSKTAFCKCIETAPRFRLFVTLIATSLNIAFAPFLARFSSQFDTKQIALVGSGFITILVCVACFQCGAALFLGCSRFLSLRPNSKNGVKDET